MRWGFKENIFKGCFDDSEFLGRYQSGRGQLPPWRTYQFIYKDRTKHKKVLSVCDFPPIHCSNIMLEDKTFSILTHPFFPR